MRRNTLIITVAAAVSVGTTAHSCVAIATSSVGLAILKQVLLGGITKGLNIFSNKDSFLGNQLIEAAMPQELRNLNSTLQKLGLNSLVVKEKEYIAHAAAFTVDISRPILINAVNSLTAEDAAKIAQGGRGAATKILREKTSQQLMAALAPKVDAKLNEFGIVQSLNSAVAGTNLLGSIFGNSADTNMLTGSISRFAAQQMVDGLFNIIESHEQQNQQAIVNAMQSAK